MGLLGSIFSFRSKKRALRSQERVIRLQRRKLRQILGLTTIKQRVRAGQLQDTLFDQGLVGSSTGATLLEQNSLRNQAENLDNEIADENLDFAKLQNKAQNTELNFEVLDSVIGIVLGAVGAGQPAPSKQVSPASTASGRVVDIATALSGVPGVLGAPGALATALQVEKARRTLPTGQDIEISGTQQAATPEAQGFTTGATGITTPRAISPSDPNIQF